MIDKNHPDYLHKCTVCKRDLPNTEYNKRCFRGCEGERLYQSRCRECCSRISKERRNLGKDIVAHKKWKLKYLYGATYEEYLQLLVKQDYRCAICGNERSKDDTNLCVDHCHKTGKIRGLLCKSCNLGISNLKDSISNLEKAITYLKEH